jgi:hypothetical protein
MDLSFRSTRGRGEDRRTVNNNIKRSASTLRRVFQGGEQRATGDKTVSSRRLIDQVESLLTRRTALAPISMSDSELSDAPSRTTPPDSDLEGALRKQVRDALKAGSHETITISSVRKAAEEALGLEAGFYKQNQRWKEESKRIVHESFVCCCSV